MDTRASLSILLLLFGISQASPLMEKRFGGIFVSEPEPVDVTERFLESNNGQEERFEGMFVSEPEPVDVTERFLESNNGQEESFEGMFVSEPEPVDVTARILESNNGSSEFLIEGDLMLPKTRNGLSCFNNYCFWKKNSKNLVEVPYTLSSEFSDSDRSVIEGAMSTFHAKTCIRFVRRSTQTNYISIESNDGCYSSLGRTGGKQVVSLNRDGCVYSGIVQHELNHALGFYHEQTRSDRDQYVKINWENISPDMANNFQKQNTNNQNTPYDYGSIMHYGKTAFSTQPWLETITPIPDETVEIGQRQGMSNIDILRINKLYGC